MEGPGGRPVDGDWRTGGFGLYVHWPYCLAKCPYCDFNSHVSSRVDTQAWTAALRSEVKRVAEATGGRVLNSVYFGGGTPSLMPPEMVGEVLAEAFTHWSPANDIEVTLEANPTSVEAGKLSAFRDAGVNRVSMGLQALNDDDLRRLGRQHSAQEGKAAFELAQRVFDRVSFDLIYARQFQSLEAWRAELREALSMQSGHLSLYQLTIEDGTVFGRMHQQGLLRGLPADDLGADFWDLTQELCEAAGLPAYEVSNHARPGQESRHNLVYWNYGDYAGVGPGAHGRLSIDGARYATAAPKDPATWLNQARSQSVDDSPVRLTRDEQSTEFLLMGLRLRDGISASRFASVAGHPLSEAAVTELVELGMIEIDGDHVRTTPSGRPLLNAILRKLILAMPAE
ncbi:MAG: radical SAM family heme chaperone HemW [Gemmobacter sp.]